MVLLSNSFAFMALLGLTDAVPEVKKRACPAVAPTIKPVMSGGYTATVVAKGFKTPREMVFDPLGNMLVVNQGGGGVSRITWTDNGGLDVCSSSIKTLINDATVCAFPHLKIEWGLPFGSLKFELNPEIACRMLSNSTLAKSRPRNCTRWQKNLRVVRSECFCL